MSVRVGYIIGILCLLLSFACTGLCCYVPHNSERYENMAILLAVASIASLIGSLIFRMSDKDSS